MPDLVQAVAAAELVRRRAGQPAGAGAGQPGSGSRPRWRPAVARAGAGETSAELTRRVLAAHLADPGPLVELHGLYEQARYSPAEIAPAVPERAADLLADVRAGLGRGAPGA